jgi:ArsR family transcriptional regulator
MTNAMLDDGQINQKSEAESIQIDLSALSGKSAEASELLKAISHEGRLLTMCFLGSGEKSVGALEKLLGVRQAAVSQQLARLRQDGLVATRRDGKTVYYRIADARLVAILATLQASVTAA